MPLPDYDYIELPPKTFTRKHKMHRFERVISRCEECGAGVLYGCAFQSHALKKTYCVETEVRRHRHAGISDAR